MRDTQLTYDFAPAKEQMLADVLTGLQRHPKQLPSRLLYDDQGARLFERICRLKEYYLTRTELRILRGALPEIAARIGPRALVLEPGSGAGDKTRLLLRHLYSPAGYVPVDLSYEQLTESAASLAREFPHVEILPLCADFTEDIELPAPSRPADSRLVFFPGSTIGNVPPHEAAGLLRRFGRWIGRGGRVLIGADLLKDRAILEAAYDDAEGLSAAFAMNVLVRLNRELDADFELDRFYYEAPFNSQCNRIEMYLVSVCDQLVRMRGHAIHFAAGERMLTEVSHKYTLQSFEALANWGGFRVERQWTDAWGLFSVHLLEGL